MGVWVDLPDLANKSTEHPVTFELWVNNEYFSFSVYMSLAILQTHFTPKNYLYNI